MVYAAQEPELKPRAGSGRSGDVAADPATHRGDTDDVAWPQPSVGQPARTAVFVSAPVLNPSPSKRGRARAFEDRC